MSLRMEKDQLRQEVEECRERLVEDTNRIEETRAELAAVRQNCFEIWKELCCVKDRNRKVERERERNIMVICSVACVFVLFVVMFGKSIM